MYTNSKAIPLKSGNKVMWFTLFNLFNTVLEGLARAMKHLKEIKSVHTGKEEVILSSIDSMML